MEITPLGDSTLVVRVASGTPDEESLNAVLDALQQLKSTKIPGIIELAPAYTTIGVFFDPTSIMAAGAKPDETLAFVAEQIRKAISGKSRHSSKTENRLIEIT